MRHWGTVLAAIGGAVLLAYLFLFDPGKGGYPGCPFRFLTGWQCPGCGSQRCAHALLHGHWTDAWAHNALLVLAIPAAALHWALLRWQGDGLSPFVRRMAWWAWAVAIIGWGVGRNLL